MVIVHHQLFGMGLRSKRAKSFGSSDNHAINGLEVTTDSTEKMDKAQQF